MNGFDYRMVEVVADAFDVPPHVVAGYPRKRCWRTRRRVRQLRRWLRQASRR